jgi:hypothetical protein
MNAIVSPAENLIAADDHRRSQFITLTFIALGYQLRTAIGDMSGQSLRPRIHVMKAEEID